MPGKVKSKKEARFLGYIAGGGKSKSGLSASKAQEMLKGTKLKKLPYSAKKKKSK